MDAKPDFSIVLYHFMCIWLHVRGGSCVCEHLCLFTCREDCTCMFVYSSQAVNRWWHAGGGKVQCQLRHASLFFFTCLLDFNNISSCHHQTQWSDIIVAAMRHWWLRSVLFGRVETNKSGVMEALLTNRVAGLLWGIKLATDGDLCLLF